ncbi:MAG: protoheme IX farnesyltransferase, partial [Myxococcales bacterium]|nr:protoheme IX farnesyltransferase [Myxococcales bacterium]
SRLRDLIALAKPRISTLVLITCAGGLWMAPGDMRWTTLLAALLGTVGIVAAANALNCYLERDSDKHMLRTRGRPLPAGRLEPTWALAFGFIMALLSLPLLALAVNPVTALLAAIALVSYVWVYTPMKQHSPAALLVGAIPGAMPPLMGWTAVTGRIEWPGLALFAIMFVWQIPHFIAISIYRRREYEKAGIVTLPTRRGPVIARRHLVAWAAVLIPTSLALVPLDVAGPIYGAIATLLGLVFVAWGLRGARDPNTGRWARQVFLYSLVYVTVLFAALLIDAGPNRLL